MECVYRDYSQLQLLAASPQVLSGGNDCDYELLLLIWNLEGRQFLVRLSLAPVYSVTRPTIDALAETSYSILLTAKETSRHTSFSGIQNKRLNELTK